LKTVLKKCPLFWIALKREILFGSDAFLCVLLHAPTRSPMERTSQADITMVSWRCFFINLFLLRTVLLQLLRPTVVGRTCIQQACLGSVEELSLILKKISGVYTDHILPEWGMVYDILNFNEWNKNCLTWRHIENFNLRNGVAHGDI
jgi:hypothetical protein